MEICIPVVLEENDDDCTGYVDYFRAFDSLACWIQVKVHGREEKIAAGAAAEPFLWIKAKVFQSGQEIAEIGRGGADASDDAADEQGRTFGRDSTLEINGSRVTVGFSGKQKPFDDVGWIPTTIVLKIEEI